ncbi:MAG: glucosyltransferase domain-containing protein [Clostridiales bacterium]|nr:glucosyltransferase domain-containing protein [Clostridiales bacterium]
MKIKKYKDSMLRFGISMAMMLVFWGGMLRKSFNADTISHMVAQDADIFWNIADGRYLIALGDAVLLKFGVRVTTNLSITMFSAFLLFAMAMVVVQKIFEQWEPEDQWAKIGYFFGLNLVFLNVLFSELLMFSECSFYFALGYLLAALGVERFRIKRYGSMFFLFILAVCVYQYTMIFAAILVAFYVCLSYEEELTPKAVAGEMLGIISCMGVGILNYLSIKVLEKTGIINSFNKNGGWGDSGQKIAGIKESFLSFNRSSFEIMPNLWIPLLFSLGVFILMIYSCIKNGKKRKLPFVFIVCAGSTILLYIIPLMQEKFSFPPRMAFCFYLLQGMLMTTAYAISTVNVHRLLSLGCAGYMIVQILFSDFVVTNHFISNTLDEVYVNMMYQEILKYEEDTESVVAKISVYSDAYAPDNYEEVNYHVHQINERALGTVTNSLIYKVTGRNFQNIGYQEEIFERYFKDKDWDYFDLSQQLIIIGDTAYWCIF